MHRSGDKVLILDTTCRDGMHAVRHQFTAEQIASITGGLDRSGADFIEVSHGDGLGGSSINYGLSYETEETLLKTAAENCSSAKLGFLLLPGIGTMRDIDMAKECGAEFARITVHCTEANIAGQHVRLAKDYGMTAFGALMMTHMIDKEELLKQGRIFEDFGADCIYCMDSAGHMLPEEVKTKIGYLCEKLEVPVGFHAHENLGTAVWNTVSAVEAGASMVDATLRGFGAGAGNTPIEVLAAVLELLNYKTNLNLYDIMDTAEFVLAPMNLRQPVKDRASLSIGYAGVYSSFMLHVMNAGKQYDLDPRDILIELGKRKVIGGQEDMIIQVAFELANK